MNLPEFPNLQRRAIDLIRSVALEKEMHPYLVGGPVRDLLLGRGSIDIDVTLEDDSSAFARALAKRAGARVKSFPQFLTYKVVAEGLPEIDIATARRERYRKPGALPAVTPGKLRDDLMRRDFSINALAIDLVTGEMHDPASGQRDLGHRVVRVLHDQSFVDDPTRIYRALRLATRLGFSIERGTDHLMSDAIRSGALATVSRERIWRELFLAMEEETAPQVLSAFSERGALEVLFGRARADVRMLEIARSLTQEDSGLDREVLYTSALLRGDASPVDLEGSGFSQKRARKVVQIANEMAHFGDALADAATERQRLRLLRHASPEMLGMLSAMLPAETSAHVERFREFQSFHLPLRGTDLEIHGGPHLARALERAREAVFTGEISPDEARSFAKEMALKYLRAESSSDQK